MTPERANEIIRAGSRWCNYSKHCTEEEDRYVRKIWSYLSGSTCWYDALRQIAAGMWDEEQLEREEAELGRKLRDAAARGRL